MNIHCEFFRRVRGQIQCYFLNKTILHTYNLGGNLTAIREYAYTTGTPGTPTKTINISYSTAWKDQMTSFDGQSITYDACGNMLTRGTRTYTWAQGKQLASVSNGHTISYQYDHNGMRVRKTVDGVVTDFRLNGDRIISRKEGSTVTYFSYDSAGQLIGMAAGSNRYVHRAAAWPGVAASSEADCW